MEEAVKEGDQLEVEIQDIDSMGKISLMPVGDEWAIPEGAAVDDQRERRPRREGDRERRPRRDRDRDRDRRGGREGGSGGGEPRRDS